MSYVGRSEAERKRMLETLGITSFEELLRDLPPGIVEKGPLAVPGPLSELEIRAHVGEIASRNDAARGAIGFLGGGMYDHYIPSALPRLVFRSEFLTCYTPYQPEVAQGTLSVIFEFQSMIAELTGLDVANASLYDGGSAVAEACLLARAHTGRPRVVIAGGLNPNYAQVVRTIAGADHVVVLPAVNGRADADRVARELNGDTAALVLAYPNFFGIVDDALPALCQRAHDAGALAIVCAEPLSLAQLTPPGEWGADVCVGEGQPLGVPISFGGPAVGFFACKKELVRRMPGRLAGQTVDDKGRRGFVLTLQTREQHIRREKATSNICTNQGLLALCATVYLALLGKEGMRQVADLCFQKTHYAAQRAKEEAGLSLAYEAPYFREFVLELPVPAAQVCHFGHERGVLVGVDLGRFDAAWSRHLLVAVTEKRTKAEIDRWARVMAEAVRAQGRVPEVAAR
ncbi:MAG TPA: aminomethyl-transferring glycine dehydrogenase subunit GcvPA [Candidatus Eisenbacteria bacterium]|nr:aminomethyl-transferring glycine dehydrogenase subunit GcvPA [Candidatus Eisenbacteria bacterium]